jgi:hypothetical protein
VCQGGALTQFLTTKKTGNEGGGDFNREPHEIREQDGLFFNHRDTEARRGKGILPQKNAKITKKTATAEKKNLF